MAANLISVYPKRKMEDITNRHSKKARLESKTYFPPVQERLPSPSSPSCSLSPHKPRTKSVQFELSRNQHIHQSPLLTPKDDDYDLSSDAEVESLVPMEQLLDQNSDYTALGSTASLLQATKTSISADIKMLARLRDTALHASKLDLVSFYASLILDKSVLPQQHKIVKAPVVSWEKYHKGLSSVFLDNDCTNNNDPIFRTLSLFGSTSE